MGRERAYRSKSLLLEALGIAIIAQTGAAVIYEVTRPLPEPYLTVRVFGDGTGTVHVTRVGESAPFLRCAKASCRVELPPGTKVQVSAVLGDKATFGGYHQVPMRTPRELVPWLGDPLASCISGDILENTGDGRDCTFTVNADTDVAAEFGEIPEEAIVKIETETPKYDELVKPLVAQAPAKPIEPEKLEEMQVALNIKPPPPMKPLPPIPPPPPPPQQQEKKPPQPPPPNMVMVEVKDKQHEVDTAPVDATKLSDKNHDVTEEMRAKETNLEKEHEGQAIASRENPDTTSKETGGPDDKIRQMEETEAPSNVREKESTHDGNKDKAEGNRQGEQGENGDDTKNDDRPLLAMRDIGGRGALIEQGKGAGKGGKHGAPGLNTPLSINDYERLMGHDKAEEERQLAARKMSSRKGKFEKKLDAVKSALENFVPDVRVGNQTALKTRAHPYAVYIARMHRRIHELWGFGFLEDLDNKPADYPLNNPDLWVNLEMSVNPDGTVHKVTIAKTSGKTEFDVAAVDTVISAGPYEAPPEAIRSVDGRIYLRWGFYRNWRQCGTFNVEPYILTSVPEDNGVGVLDDGAMVKNMPKITGRKKHPTGDKPVTPDDGKSTDRVNPTSSVTDQQALHAANLWTSAFSTAQVDKLVKYSTVPFYAGGKIAAQSTAELKEMYSGLVVESGPMKDWKLLTPGEYSSGSGALPEGNLVLQVRTAKESFAVVLTRTKSGDYRATQLAR